MACHHVYVNHYQTDAIDGEDENKEERRKEIEGLEKR